MKKAEFLENFNYLLSKTNIGDSFFNARCIRIINEFSTKLDEVISEESKLPYERSESVEDMCLKNGDGLLKISPLNYSKMHLFSEGLVRFHYYNSTIPGTYRVNTPFTGIQIRKAIIAFLANSVFGPSPSQMTPFEEYARYKGIHLDRCDDESIFVINVYLTDKA